MALPSHEANLDEEGMNLRTELELLRTDPEMNERTGHNKSNHALFSPVCLHIYLVFQKMFGVSGGLFVL
jgi:hypothetical protein